MQKTHACALIVLSADQVIIKYLNEMELFAAVLKVNEPYVSQQAETCAS